VRRGNNLRIGVRLLPSPSRLGEVSGEELCHAEGADAVLAENLPR